MSLASLKKIQLNQFWVFQAVGWAALVGILTLLTLVFNPPTLDYLLPLIFVYAASALVAAILTSALRLIYLFTWNRGFVVRFLLAGIGSLLAALLWQVALNNLEIFALDSETIMDRLLFGEFFIFTYPLILLWSGLYFILKYNQLFQREKEKSLRSEALANEAQLSMLRYQLNPHFLFNTLNAISTLVLSEATSQANEMVTKLSKFLRYSLDHSPLDRVSLEHELETSRLYLDIEKVRFAERLKLLFDIDKNTYKALVPTMLLQPIIENSIKHGVSQTEVGGEISIKAYKEKDSLVLELADDGPGLPDLKNGEVTIPQSKGVGISNITNRLREIYTENHKIIFINLKPRGLMVKVIIPYEE